MRGCSARQYSDQKQCDRCGLIWDMNDPDPPKCKTDEELRREHGREALEGIKRALLL